jgi:toxin ParE1/3/4
MKPVEHLAIVTLEMARAALWYERREMGLGERFLSAVREAESFISKNPLLGQPFRRDTRKWRAPGFPYRVIYREEPARIMVFAVAHAKRRPGYWLARLR